MFNRVYRYQQLGVGFSEVFSTLGIVLLQFTIALTLSLGTLTLGTRIYMKINRQTDELEEIANNNIAVAMVVGAITVILALMLSNGMGTFLDALMLAPPSLNKNLPY